MFLNVIYLFMAVLGLRCCVGFPQVAVSGSHSLVVRRLLIVVASLRVRGLQQLQHSSYSCSMACGIFLNQGLIPFSHLGRQILYHWATGEASFACIISQQSPRQSACSHDDTCNSHMVVEFSNSWFPFIIKPSPELCFLDWPIVLPCRHWTSI